MEIIKVNKSFELTVKLTLDDVKGLVKFIGPTSREGRMRDYNLSLNESSSLSHIYDRLSDILDNKNDE